MKNELLQTDPTVEASPRYAELLAAAEAVSNCFVCGNDRPCTRLYLESGTTLSPSNKQFCHACGEALRARIGELMVNMKQLVHDTPRDDLQRSPGLYALIGDGGVLDHHIICGHCFPGFCLRVGVLVTALRDEHERSA